LGLFYWALESHDVTMNSSHMDTNSAACCCTDKGVVVEQSEPKEFFGNPQSERLQRFLGKY
jgi:ABC-type histidine transport system ATPase subunit